MGLSAAVIDALVMAGVTVEQLAAAMKAELSEAGHRLDEKRAKDAERQRRSRLSRSVTVTPRDGADKKKSPQTPKEKTTPLNGSPKGEPIPPSDDEQIALNGDHVLEAFNAMADRAGLTKAKMTDERRKKLKPFIRRHPIDDITEAIAAIERSPFLRGENERAWKADFNWMLEPRNFTKLIEGTYDR